MPRKKKQTRGPTLTVEQILDWADAHYRRTGKWASVTSGRIAGTRAETWQAVHDAFRRGGRGLPAGSTLARFLARHRGKPYHIRFVHGRKLTIKQVMAWARSHHKRTSRWPSGRSGAVQNARGETWTGIDQALRHGFRGLPKKGSLAKLLGKTPGSVRNLHSRRLSCRQILAWADAHHQRTGEWPMAISGVVHDAPGETWGAIHSGLRYGQRGLRGGISLHRLLVKYRGIPIVRRKPPRLSIKQILAWADAYYDRTGSWPTQRSGRVAEAPEETWSAVHSALVRGVRGLQGGTTLPRILAKYRGKRNFKNLPDFDVKQILAWADAHHKRTSRWPNVKSGAIREAPGETWLAVASAMYNKSRGMSGKLTLSGLLAKYRGVRPHSFRTELTRSMILRWARIHRRRTGRWPTKVSGPVRGVPGESWNNINASLVNGERGLKGRSSLSRLLSPLRGDDHVGPPRGKLTIREILMWARAFCRRTGTWPDVYDGGIPDAPGESWRRIDEALREGTRGLPGGSSLARLFTRRRKPKPLTAWARSWEHAIR